MGNEEMENYRQELQKLIDLLDRVNSPQARQVIASRFQQIMAEMVAHIESEAA